MKEIKFRAWANASKVMFLPDEEDGWRIQKGEFCPIPNTVLMQFTGLLDKNGKEIYEGNILRGAGIVEWNQKNVRWSCIDIEWNNKREQHNMLYLTTPLEVIGNIYQNPELLK